MLETTVRRFRSGERYRETRLRNGFGVASLYMPGAKTVAVGIWVPYGSKHERRGQRGWAHLLEHMLFKQTETHSAKAMADLRDRYPDTNAQVGVDGTLFRIVSRPEDIGDILALLYEMFALPAFDDHDLNVERKVVFHEAAEDDDSAEQRAAAIADVALFAGSNHAQLPHGLREDLLQATATKMRNLRKRAYVTSGSWILVTGAVRHNQVLRIVGESFGKLRRSYPRAKSERGEARPRTGLHTSVRKLRQAYLIHGYLTPPASHPDFMALELFKEHANMESGPFTQELRGGRGATYSVRCELHSVSRYGSFTVGLHTRPARLASVSTALHKIVSNARIQPMDRERLDSVKERYEAWLRYKVESPLEMLEYWAESLAIEGRFVPLSERLVSIRAVTLGDVHRVVREYLGVPPVIVAVGPDTAVTELRDAEKAWNRSERRRMREWRALQEQVAAEDAEDDDEDAAAA